MIAAAERQYQPVPLYKNTHLRIYIKKYTDKECIFKENRNPNHGQYLASMSYRD
jgi:hypothetical protein